MILAAELGSPEADPETGIREVPLGGDSKKHWWEAGHGAGKEESSSRYANEQAAVGKRAGPSGDLQETG